jgi:hypothetical protein
MLNYALPDEEFGGHPSSGPGAGARIGEHGGHEADGDRDGGAFIRADTSGTDCDETPT